MHYFLLAALARGERVLLLDAANSFNPHRLAELAARRGFPEAGASGLGDGWNAPVSPEEWLERVLISRAFTCFQLAELVERVPAAARRYRARRVVVTGVPEIFDDEELSAAEAERVFRRSLNQMRRWPAQGLTALVFSDAEATRPLGRRLRRLLERIVTERYRLTEGPEGLRVVAGALESGAKGVGSRPLPSVSSPTPDSGTRTREGSHGTHHRHLSPVDRADAGALRSLPAGAATGRPTGV